MGATYLHAKLDEAAAGSSKNGFIAELGYAGAKAAKVGSWGLAAKYYQLPAGGFVANAWEAVDNPVSQAMYQQGAKGWWARANYTVAKNMIAQIEYWDMKSRTTDVKNKALLTALYVSF